MLEKKYYKEAFERADPERKNLILEIGIEEFSSKGYENANINIIAKKVGISIGLMYKYFATKEDLFITCLKYGMDILEKALYDIMVSDDKLLIKAEKLVRTICMHSKKHSNYIKMYNEICSEKGSLERMRSIAEEIESRRSSIYITSITSALKSGDVRSDLDPKLFALFLDNLLTSLQFAYTCDYYREKFRIYTNIDINKSDDEQVISQLLKFIESAFSYEK
ncbi:MAG TPA: TetR/AcrR family transcriptional regulator [Candidatus Eubacterium faecigallinarum]|nr:TetR/AcrR family transcriptional regulator [Candidatus Eubacterium faecigallinarum]